MSRAPASSAGATIFLADAHLGAHDPLVDEFCAVLDGLQPAVARVVLLGDIFTLWLGRPRHSAPHHHAVLEACRRLRARGIAVVFVEGNREFSAGCWEGDAFDAVVDAFELVGGDGRRWFIAHGDLLDRSDRKARAFRAVVRSAPLQLLVRVLPRRAAAGLAARVERGLRHRNLRYKTAVPRARFEGYARWVAARGYDAAAIGHIHVEQVVAAEAAGRRATLFVLPDWRSTRRHLQLAESGAAEFVGAPGAAAPAPAILVVVERDGRAEVELDIALVGEPGAAVSIDSGHGSGARRGTIVARADDGRFVQLALDDGAPLQVGDRVHAEGGARIDHAAGAAEASAPHRDARSGS